MLRDLIALFQRISYEPAGAELFSILCQHAGPARSPPDRVRPPSGNPRPDKGFFAVDQLQLAPQVFDVAIDGAVGDHPVVVIEIILQMLA